MPCYKAALVFFDSRLFVFQALEVEDGVEIVEDDRGVEDEDLGQSSLHGLSMRSVRRAARSQCGCQGWMLFTG